MDSFSLHPCSTVELQKQKYHHKKQECCCLESSSSHPSSLLLSAQGTWPVLKTCGNKTLSGCLPRAVLPQPLGSKGPLGGGVHGVMLMGCNPLSSQLFSTLTRVCRRQGRDVPSVLKKACRGVQSGGKRRA